MVENPANIIPDPLLLAFNYFDARELSLLRERYGYGLISRDNLARHLSILGEYPFLLDALIASCSGSRSNNNNIHADAWLNLLAKISYGTPDDLALLSFEICSGGEGRVHYRDVLRVAKAASNLIRAYPLSQGVTHNQGEFLLPLPSGNYNMTPDLSVYCVNEQGGINKRDGESSASDGGYVPVAINRNGGYEMLGLADDVVDYLFSADKKSATTKSTGKQYLSYKEYLDRAKFLPEASRCFGFFDFLYFLLVASVVSKLDTIPTLENFIPVAFKVKGIPGTYHYCTVQLRDRFLLVTKKGRLHPWISLPLWHSTAKATGRMRNKVVIHSTHAQVKLKAPSAQDALLWVHCLRGNSRGNNRFDSFAPVHHEDHYCKWFVNAKSYFEGLISTIPKAQYQILIIGWAFSPTMSLNRPSNERRRGRRMPAYRTPAGGKHHARMVGLIDLIVERARAGVKVRVLVWNETNWGYKLNSHENKNMLEGLHENIEVIRHPPIIPLRWSHHQKMVIIDQRIAFIGGIDLVVGRYDDKYSRVCDLDGSIFPGRDYNNLVLGGVEEGDPNQTQLDRRIQARLPWHDTAVCVVGAAAYDAAVSIIQIWNHAITHSQGHNHHTRLVPYPALHQELLARGNVINEIFDLDKTVDPLPGRVSGGLSCQIVRSISPWAGGQAVESSYYRSILDTIRRAQHFVYIQNQFFISSIMHRVPGNKVALAIVERISMAIQTGSNFRVYILLPIHSAGPVTSLATRAIMHWTRYTLFHGKESIFGKLRQRFSDVDINNYISVCALRNWQVANDIIFTEQVYVHSKLVIADDRIAIIGSGNINDRSLRGARDSESGVVISGGNVCVTLEDGRPYEKSEFVHSLRMKLWQVHLGLNPAFTSDRTRRPVREDPLADTRPLVPEDPAEMRACAAQITDATNDATYHGVWRRVAQWNRAVFRDVFGDGIVENWTSAKEGQRRMFAAPSPMDIQKLGTVRGHLIEFPEEMCANDKGFIMWLLTTRLKVNLVT